MVHMLSLTENLHTILRVLYDDMMVLCYPMSQVAMAIAGIGALLYIAYRVWQSLAQAEPIDLFPLMRPFAIGICILFFPTLVLGSLNGILSPLVKATHSLMVGQTLDMEQWQERRERLELEGREQMPPDSYYAEDEEMERELSELGVDDQTQQTLDRMKEERSSWSVKGLDLQRLGMDTRTALRGGERHTRRAENLSIWSCCRCWGRSPSPSPCSTDSSPR